LVANPRPALTWAVIFAVLVGVELGALLHFGFSIAGDIIAVLSGSLAVVTDPLLGILEAAETFAANLPTLLSREVVPNDGHWNGSRWVNTFLGLPPAIAWTARVALVYGYAFAFVGWCWVGYDRYRRHYRAAEWSPRDDVLDRLRSHYWGLFGFVVVFMFVTMAVFAPTLGPTTVEENIRNPAAHETTYWDAEAETVETVNLYSANINSRSVGDSSNVGPWTYDDYGRFHPFGTLDSGKDLFTFIAAGARVSLMIGLFAVGLNMFIATVLALVSAYYKGRVDDSLVLLSDSVMALPQLLLLIMLTVVLADTFIGNLYSGAFVLALIFAGTGWPYMWRSVRGPALQVSEREWVDAAKSFGQRPLTVMRKHMLPYIVGYLLIYGSMTLGGAIIAIAGLSFLGLGVNPPTPEWGRAVNLGQDYVDTASWHISLIPGALITLVVTGFNALGDGIRDAIDPQSDSATGEAAGRGGGA
jgi:peptide/nickel transport system permease protein